MDSNSSIKRVAPLDGGILSQPSLAEKPLSIQFFSYVPIAQAGGHL